MAGSFRLLFQSNSITPQYTIYNGYAGFPSAISEYVPLIFVFSISVSSNIATINAYYNGTYNSTHTVTAPVNFIQFNGLEIGNWTSQFSSISGGISSVIIYNTVLTDVQRNQIEGYLAWKWWDKGSAILTNTSHPYYSVPIGDLGTGFNPISS